MNNHNNSVENEFKPLPTKNNPRSLLCKKRVRPIEEDNNDICMICNWKFPSTMIADEKNLQHDSGAGAALAAASGAGAGGGRA